MLSSILTFHIGPIFLFYFGSLVRGLLNWHFFCKHSSNKVTLANNDCLMMIVFPQGTRERLGIHIKKYCIHEIVKWCHFYQLVSLPFSFVPIFKPLMILCSEPYISVSCIPLVACRSNLTTVVVCTFRCTFKIIWTARDIRGVKNTK